MRKLQKLESNSAEGEDTKFPLKYGKYVQVAADKRHWLRLELLLKCITVEVFTIFKQGQPEIELQF